MSFQGMISKPDGTGMRKIERMGQVNTAEEASQLGHKAGMSLRESLGDMFAEYQHAVAAATETR